MPEPSNGSILEVWGGLISENNPLIKAGWLINPEDGAQVEFVLRRYGVGYERKRRVRDGRN